MDIGAKKKFGNFDLKFFISFSAQIKLILDDFLRGMIIGTTRGAFLIPFLKKRGHFFFFFFGNEVLAPTSFRLVLFLHDSITNPGRPESTSFKDSAQWSRPDENFNSEDVFSSFFFLFFSFLFFFGANFTISQEAYLLCTTGAAVSQSHTTKVSRKVGVRRTGEVAS